MNVHNYASKPIKVHFFKPGQPTKVREFHSYAEYQAWKERKK